MRTLTHTHKTFYDLWGGGVEYANSTAAEE